jgi:hypothetical protein
MTMFDDPNREAVGVAPIWAEGAEPKAEAQSSSFDPSAYTVDEVNAWLDKNPDQRQAVLDAEAAGKARAGILGS